MFLLLGFGLIGMIVLYFVTRNARLGSDRTQHHLASMLIAIAAGRDEVSREDVTALLRAKRWSKPQIAVRMNHAVSLAGTAVSGELYEKVVQLAREMIATA